MNLKTLIVINFLMHFNSSKYKEVKTITFNRDKIPSQRKIEKWSNGKIRDTIDRLYMFIGSIFMSIIIYYLAVYIFPSSSTKLYFTIIMTLSNILAILFSWMYFNSTKCLENDLNPLTVKGNKIFGEDIYHTILFVFRFILNGYFIWSLFNNNNIFESYMLFSTEIYPIVILHSFITSLWLIEAIINIFANLQFRLADNPQEYMCKLPKNFNS